MACLLPSSRSALSCVALLASLAVQAPASAQPAPGRSESGSNEPAALCERAARQTLAAQGTAEVSFGAAPAYDTSLSNEGQVALRGSGRARAANGARVFSYLCTVDLATREAVGLVLRDQAPAAPKAAPARPPAEPDLRELSPAACESSAAEALRRQWPRVSSISFDRSTRRFRQPAADLAELHGSGLALPAPGAPNTVFTFDCKIDPRDGWVLETNVSG